MELIFDFDQRQGIANVRFEGLDGTEGVTSTKQTLSLLKIRNPACAFADAVKTGAYKVICAYNACVYIFFYVFRI